MLLLTQTYLPSTDQPASVAGRAGRFESLTLGLYGTNPRFPWKPSTAMLTYRLIGTTQASGSTTTNPISLRHGQPTSNSKRRRIFAHHGAPRRRRRDADLRSSGGRYWVRICVGSIPPYWV